MKNIILTSILVITPIFTNAKEVTKATGSENIVNVTIGKDGFKPNPITIKQGHELTLLVKRTTKKTCMTNLKNPISGKLVEMPLDKEVRFKIGKFDSKKTVKLLCGMDMKAGVIQIK